MKANMKKIIGCLGFLVLLGPSPVFAQTTAPAATTKEVVPQPGQKIELKSKIDRPITKKEGWFPKLSLGISLALNDSRKVPGVDDGLTLGFGLVLSGELLYLRRQHKWLTELKVVHTQTRTPNLGLFVKTADDFDLKTAYTYQLQSSIGIFVSGQITSALFAGDLILVEDQTAAVKGFKGNLTGEKKQIGAKVPFRLTPGFSPLLLKQAIGLDATPHEDKNSKFSMKLGAAAQEVFASGFAVEDDAATPELEIRQLQNYAQAGVQLNVVFTGSFNKQVSYSFLTEFLYPVVTNVATDLKGFDLLNTDISLKVSLKLSDWASLDYLFSAKKIPLLSERWQVVNNLVLSLSANIL